MLDRKRKYLQIAFNRNLEEIKSMIYSLPLSDQILIEVGYPLIKRYGVEAIRKIRQWWTEKIFTHLIEIPSTKSKLLTHFLIKSLSKTLTEDQRELAQKETETTFAPYIVADLKCMDRAFAEVETAKLAGASAVTCLGLAPTETINLFVEKCEEFGLDSILDMLNVDYPFEVLQKLKRPPKIIMLHRGVDEGEENKEREIPYHEIERIKSVYDDVLIAVAGGETIEEVVHGTFNGADIVVVWRLFNENQENITKLANEFLKEIK